MATAGPPRRSVQALPRFHPNSVEALKAENQKLRERNLILTAALLPRYKKTDESLHSSTRDIAMNSPVSSSLLVHTYAIANGGPQPLENIPLPNDADPANPVYSFDTTDIFPDFDPTTFHIFLQMLSRFCIYKPDSIQIDRIKQIWRLRDYFDIPTLLLNENDLVTKIRDETMTTFAGIQKELDFALRYNWRALRVACLEVLRLKTGDIGGLSDSIKDVEIMNLLDTLVVAERRKSGIVDKEEGMDANDLEGIRWTTPSEDGIEVLVVERDEDGDASQAEDIKHNMDEIDDGEDSGEPLADETTMDIA